jgi:hypothetical protein
MRGESVDLTRISPGRKPGYDVELAEEAAHDLVGIPLRTQPIDLGHHAGECLLDVTDGA